LDERSDNELVIASCQGNRTAYGVLVRRHYNQTFLICLGVLGHVHDAEDAAQDAMIKGFQQICQLRTGSQYGAWVGAIARNLSVNLLRKRKMTERVLGAEESLRRHEGRPPRDDVRQAVARLPWDLRLPLVMYYFDGQNVKTVAEKLEISTSGVYQKLKAAIKELHEMLMTQGDMP
jgi:RNA polymerase sigma-70 factor (ECF subfamily)